MFRKLILILIFLYAPLLYPQTLKTLFNNLDTLLNRLNKIEAKTFSPANFNKGLELYYKAKKMASENQNKEDIFAVIQDAESYFYKAKERTKINSDLFFYVVTLKNKIKKRIEKSEGAKFFFNKGEKAFSDGISLSENGGKLKDIKNKIGEAINNFNIAKIIAKKDKLFTPVIKLRSQAKKSNAEYFSPTNFERAESFFTRALDYASKDNGEDFTKSILSAQKLFKSSIETSRNFSSFNSEVLTAMEYAEKSDAKIFANETFSKAMELLKKAASEYEKGEISNSGKDAILAAKLFWDSEKDAIYFKYIGEPESELDSLENSGNLEEVKILIRTAKVFLNKAKSLFNQNRYNNRISVYSEKAKNEINRLERIAGIYASGYQNLIDSLIIKNAYPFNFIINTSQGNQKEENKKIKPDKIEKTSKDVVKITTKKTAVKKTGKAKSVNNKKENLTSVGKTANYIKRIFTRNEVKIIKQGNSFIKIRLLGLKLKAYQKKLTPSQKNFLMKLYNAILYSKKVKRVVIEVYSDSKGGDKLNKKLSQIRANVIKSTLVEFGLNKQMIVAKGIGNKNPIASNATFEGRNKNRRIEIILTFEN